MIDTRLPDKALWCSFAALRFQVQPCQDLRVLAWCSEAALGQAHTQLFAVRIASLEALSRSRVLRLLTTGLEPVTQGEQILSLSCLPISPSELFIW